MWCEHGVHDWIKVPQNGANLLIMYCKHCPKTLRFGPHAVKGLIRTVVSQPLPTVLGKTWPTVF